MSQRVTVPSFGRPALKFALRVSGGDVNDGLTLTVDGHSVRTYTGAQSGPSYRDQVVDLTPYRGRTVTLAWTGTEDDATPTTFLLDDITISG